MVCYPMTDFEDRQRLTMADRLLSSVSLLVLSCAIPKYIAPDITAKLNSVSPMDAFILREMLRR